MSTFLKMHYSVRNELCPSGFLATGQPETVVETNPEFCVCVSKSVFFKVLTTDAIYCEPGWSAHKSKRGIDCILRNAISDTYSKKAQFPRLGLLKRRQTDRQRKQTSRHYRKDDNLKDWIVYLQKHFATNQFGVTFVVCSPNHKRSL